MIKKFFAGIGLIMLIWALIDPVSCGEFIRYAGRSLVAALRSAGQEG